MKREFSFANLGKVLMILGFVFYAGCVLPVAQVWCVLVCLEGLSMDPDGNSTSHCVKLSDNSRDVACNTPSSTELLVSSHNSEVWAPNVEMPMSVLSEARFVSHQSKPNIDVPELSVTSPPPKSESLA